MSIDYRLHLPPIEPALLHELGALGQRVFARFESDYLAWRLSNMPDVSVFCARSEGELIGFKAGYAMSQRKYYSWLGGVRPDARRRGVASQLMRRQHAWLATRGYASVETATNQDNAAMLQANLRHGFTVSGLRTEPDRVQILLAKAIDASPVARTD